MGVVAVPGSGKTRTLSYLAAQLVAESDLQDGQEVLVVTLVNAAAGNFARQVGEFVKERGLLPNIGYRVPNIGYRVRTLHGLANDIVRERPALAGLGDGFNILDERDTGELLQDAAYSWARTHAGSYQDYLGEEHLDNARVIGQEWRDLVKDTAANFIRQAKDFQLEPDTLRELLKAYGDSLPLAEMGLDIYEAYERGLRYRGAVDFQDLIRLALRALEADRDYLNRLQYRWPFILEDEAQDSSQLQERIIRLLVDASSGYWSVKTATGCASVIRTRPSMRPSPPPARISCGTSSRSAASNPANYRTVDAAPRASSGWRTGLWSILTRICARAVPSTVR